RSLRELVVLAFERVDCRARTRMTAEKQIQIGKVEPRLLHREQSTGAASEIDRRLEVREGGLEIAVVSREPGEIEPARGGRRGVARFLGGRERSFVGTLGFG